MKILYMNLLYNNSGQRRMDENIICELVKMAEVYVVCSEGWYEHMIKGANYIFFEPKTCIRNSYFSDYIKDIKNIFYANAIRKKYNFDICLFASYNTVIFPLWRLIAHEVLNSCFIVHNNNIDGIDSSKLKKKLFNIYSRKVNHIVLEYFIRDYLVDNLKISKKRVFVIPHPLNSNNFKSDKIYNCVGISNSNDDEWIKEIIKIEKQTSILENNMCKVVLRSKKYEYDDGWLMVINGWLNDEEYNKYINQARMVFLPFPITFQYRMSGSVVDAFSNYTAVIGSAIPLFLYLSLRYKNICCIANTPNDFMNTIASSAKSVINDAGFDAFINDHSNAVVFNSLKKMISSYKQK